MVIADLDLLILTDYTALDTADGNSADILVVVNAGNEHLEGALDVLLGFGNVLEDGIKQRLEVRSRNLGGIACGTLTAGTEQHRGIKLLIGCVKVHEKLKNLVNDLVDTLVGTVDLIDDDDDPVAQLKCP